MSDRTVHFREIKLHRAKGIALGEGFVLTDLVPEVNLIHGPNGSGKSTTAAVIQELLWPGKTGLERPSASGQYSLEDKCWQVEIDAGRVTTSCEGNPSEPVSMGPPDNRPRYHLALHDLVLATSDDSNFALQVVRNIQGGYDLDLAISTLEFTHQPSRPTKESKALVEAYKKVDEATRRQRDTSYQESQLASVEQERDHARAAAAAADTFLKAEAHQRLQRSFEQNRMQLDGFPAVMARLQGDEDERLNEIQEQLENGQRDLDSQQLLITEAEREIQACRLSEGGFNESTLREVRAAQAELQAVESKIEQCRTELNRSLGEESVARARLGDHASEDQLRKLSSLGPDTQRLLDGFIQRCHQLQAKTQLLSRDRVQLSQLEPPEIAGLALDQLRRGIDALGEWLATPVGAVATSRGSIRPITILAAISLLTSLVLAFVHHGVWMVALLAAAGTMIWEFFRQRRIQSDDPAGGDSRSTHRIRYERAGLHAPQDWSPTQVSSLLLQLIPLAEKRASADAQSQKVRELDALEAELEQDRSRLQKDRAIVESSLGLTLSVVDGWFPVLVDNISRWQQAHARASGLQRNLDSLLRLESDCLERINVQLRPLGYEPVRSLASATETMQDLDNRRAKHDRATQRKSDALARIDKTIRRALDAAMVKRKTMLEQIGITDSDQWMLEAWINDLPKYRDILKEHEHIKRELEGSLAALTGHEDLLKLESQELKLHIESKKQLAERMDELADQVANIRASVQQAKDGFELSAALEARRQADDRLVDMRGRMSRSAVGAVLTDFVRSTTLELSRPKVFTRARELLARFTHGHLELDLDDRANPPAFRAGGPGQVKRPIEQLSVGERVQLLMAVRLAFLEENESLRLPLILDEALGTSDDVRAGAIIDSVIELARMGRQVFYFTAQADEAGKWMARLEAARVGCKVINLSSVKKMSPAIPLAIASLKAEAIPEPGTMSYIEYGHSLNVGDLDFWTNSIDQIHLWHMLRDARMLHRLLDSHISTYGQLRTLVDAGAGDLAGLNNADIRNIRARASVIEESLRCWRIGRGKQVDRLAILNSEVVSSAFVDRLSDLAAHHHGDAKAIIHSLNNRELPRWRTENTDLLVDYLQRQGYLSTEEPLAPEQLRVHVMAAVAEEMRSGVMDLKEMDELLTRLLGSGQFT